MEQVTTHPAELPTYQEAVALAAQAAELRRLKATAKALDVPYWWLRSFARGQIKSAGYTRVRNVIHHFRAHPLPTRAPGVTSE
jgi:hypothetical protein